MPARCLPDRYGDRGIRTGNSQQAASLFTEDAAHLPLWLFALDPGSDGYAALWLFAAVELKLCEPGIKTILHDQAVMIAFFHDTALIHHDDPVRRTDRCQTVGDDNGRPVLHQLVERVLNQFLAFSIQRRSRFVEQQDRCVAQQSPGDGYPLTLAARKPGFRLLP